jgi:hypothetical protein
MSVAEREAADTLARSCDWLAALATQRLYVEQPDLERLGANGRARVLEDFGHHFRALASLDTPLFLAHSSYCYGLFAHRGFPRHWLDDAWRIMRVTVLEQFDDKVSDPVIRLLDQVPKLET